LKHVIERWASSYVSNGACIEAARQLGLALRGPSGPSLNCFIGVSRRSVSQVRKEGSINR
jgi:hypothetical protein